LISRLFHPSISKGLLEISNRGAKNSCPFCRARINKEIKSGDEIVLLHGYTDAGRHLIVDCWSDRSSGWLCKDIEEEGTTRRVLNTYNELFLKTPLPKPPEWALSLAVEDNLLIDDVLMRIVADSKDINNNRFDVKKLDRVAAFCWHQRIPFDTKEMLAFLLAHGLHENLIKKAILVLDVARHALLTANGKNSIKRRRMVPFSAFRYWPNSGSSIL
jgi:hypothetical protein